MTKDFVLEASVRDIIGKKVKLLRREGKLPAVIYGYDVAPTPIVLDTLETEQVLKEGSTSTLVTLNVDGNDYIVLVRDQQKSIINRDLLHVDFQAINLEEKVRAQVDIVLSSQDAPAVEEHGALLVTGLDTLEIECMPQELPEEIVVDVSVLENIGDTVIVRDLDLPENITLLDDPTTMLVVATPPSEIIVEEEEEEEELLDLELGLEEPEVIEKGKTEEEVEEVD
ncbi:MAG: 50S ribosomal protein L25 [Chloroflexota bacterium]|nr:50S ribosomal protein L25 [Chloroflexota bacterium]